MGVKPLASVASVLLSTLLLAACGGDPPDESAETELRRAIDATLAAGPSTVRATTESGIGTFALDGDLVISTGSYRLCGELVEAPTKGPFGVGTTVRIAATGGAYKTLVKIAGFPGTPSTGCGARGWFDDHPPTLALFAFNRNVDTAFPEGAAVGAESYLHLVLLAVAEFDRAAIEVERSGEDSYAVRFGFPAADEEPSSRSEDRWQMEPLLRRIGQQSVVFTAANGLLESVSLTAPGVLRRESGGTVEVGLAFTGVGEGKPVPLRAEVSAME